MDEEATELPREPKKEVEDATNPGDGVFEQDSEGGFQITFDSASPLAKLSTVASSSSVTLATPDIYIPE